jgi:hypothetical protein
MEERKVAIEEKKLRLHGEEVQAKKMEQELQDHVHGCKCP